MMDGILTHQRTVGARPAWTLSPAEIQAQISSEALPMKPQGEAEVYDQFVNAVLPFGNGNAGPRFYGWVQGNGCPLGTMADMLASGMNPHLAGFNQNPVLVERKVVEWMRELLGFPTGSSGLLLSGGSMANFTGLAIARNAKAGFDVRGEGLAGHPRLMLYGSSETHSWAQKAIGTLGLGTNSYRQVPVRDDFRLDLVALERLIREDLDQGLRPIAAIGTAGTVNTGATDDLVGLADICRRYGLWLHVDGAFGALAALSSRLRPMVSGLELADSVAFDLHKWMYLPFEIACLLVRDGEAHRRSFAQSASYIDATDRGVMAGGLQFSELGLELTRGFKALKAWMCLKAYGVERFAALIEQNVDQAQYLASLVSKSSCLELVAPVPMNIVCFRYVSDGLPALALNSLNEEILFRVQERGLAVPSSTVIGGKFCLRACFVNHRTTMSDVDALVGDVEAIGREIGL